jgi:hypothetical protein
MLSDLAVRDQGSERRTTGGLLGPAQARESPMFNAPLTVLTHVQFRRVYSTSEFRVLRPENVQHVKHRLTPASGNQVLVQVSGYLFN